MRARGWWVIAALAFPRIAGAEPKPKPVDIKPFRDRVLVLADAQGGTYVVLPAAGAEDPRIFFGTAGKTLYEQVIVTRSADGSTGMWDLGTWAPRIKEFTAGSIMHKPDGSFSRWCGSDSELGLTQLTGDKAKAVLDKSSFATTALIHAPYLLARDDHGVYYYIDVIRQQYGGKGYRVFVGKKGAMKEMPLTDIATDSAGDVFATKTGDLRFVHATENGKGNAAWLRGEKRTELIELDPNLNQALIFKDLGVYAFIGTLCDNL